MTAEQHSITKGLDNMLQELLYLLAIMAVIIGAFVVLVLLGFLAEHWKELLVGAILGALLGTGVAALVRGAILGLSMDEVPYIWGAGVWIVGAITGVVLQILAGVLINLHDSKGKPSSMASDSMSTSDYLRYQRKAAAQEAAASGRFSEEEVKSRFENVDHPRYGSK